MLKLFCGLLLLSSTVGAAAIDREAVVQRHRVVLHGVGGEPASPTLNFPLTLPVGNGVVGFNADATGMQSLNNTYKEFPLTTLSDWGWHSSPPPEPTSQYFKDYEYKMFNISTGRSVPYPLNQGGKFGWLRENPHRLDLIQVGLRRQSDTFSPLIAGDISDATQVLDPYTGELVSNFSIGVRAAFSSETCSPVGTWYSAGDRSKHNQFTVAVSTAATRCPGAHTGTFLVDSQYAWHNESFCTYANGSLWYQQNHGTNDGGWSGEFGAIKTAAACDSIRWQDGAEWCRGSSSTCLSHKPSPAPTPVPPPAPTEFVPVQTRTVMHMDLDILSWRIESAMLSPSESSRAVDGAAGGAESSTVSSIDDTLVVRVAFPYGSGADNGPGHDWSKDSAHTTTVVRRYRTSTPAWAYSRMHSHTPVPVTHTPSAHALSVAALQHRFF
jgi:hypothetical protein